jgi:hypothetical protein
MDIEQKIREMNHYLSDLPQLTKRPARHIWDKNVMPADIDSIKKCKDRVEPLPYMTPVELL